MLIKWKAKNNYKSHLRTIRVIINTQSEFAFVNCMLRSNRNIVGTIYNCSVRKDLVDHELSIVLQIGIRTQGKYTSNS